MYIGVPNIDHIIIDHTGLIKNNKTDKEEKEFIENIMRRLIEYGENNDIDIKTITE